KARISRNATVSRFRSASCGSTRTSTGCGGRGTPDCVVDIQGSLLENIGAWLRDRAPRAYPEAGGCSRTSGTARHVGFQEVVQHVLQVRPPDFLQLVAHAERRLLDAYHAPQVDGG